MAAPSSVLAWRIPGMAEPGGLPSYGVAQNQTRLKHQQQQQPYLSMFNEESRAISIDI